MSWLEHRVSSAEGLTVRQREVFSFVIAYEHVTRELPTLGLIARRFQISRQRAHVYLRTLREKHEQPWIAG